MFNFIKFFNQIENKKIQNCTFLFILDLFTVKKSKNFLLKLGNKKYKQDLIPEISETRYRFRTLGKSDLSLV